jgi:hypothetical protein
MKSTLSRIVLAALCIPLMVGCSETITGPGQIEAPASPVAQAMPSPAAVNRDMVARYARENWNRTYGTGSTQNPFCNYGSQTSGGNCTNFASQAIMAGLVGSSNPQTVYSRRRDFQVDRSAQYVNSYQWYFESCGIKGPAWAGAHKLWEFAKYNKATYKSLHFAYVTHDTPTQFMEYSKVMAGDIIFADWENDGRFDHTMIVVRYDGAWYSLNRGYNRVRVAYQNQDGFANQGDMGLGTLNEKYNYKAVFHVYRPVDYSWTGL